MDRIEEITARITELTRQLDEVEGTQCEIYTRIVGYHRAIENWNKGKKAEYGVRKVYNTGLALEGRPKEYALLGACSGQDDEAEAEIALPTPEQLDNIAGVFAEMFGRPKKEILEIFTKNHEPRKLYYLGFFGKSCPLCPVVKKYLEQLDLPGRIIEDAAAESNIDLCRKHNVMSVPTVIFFDADSHEVARASSVSEIEQVLADAAA